MVKDILDAIRCRNEDLTWLERSLVIREVQSGAQLGEDTDKLDSSGLMWRVFVRSIFDKETNTQVFQDDDIPELAKSSRFKLALLWAAVNRVNGLDGEDNEKNLQAVQA